MIFALFWTLSNCLLKKINQVSPTIVQSLQEKYYRENLIGIMEINIFLLKAGSPCLDSQDLDSPNLGTFD